MGGKVGVKEKGRGRGNRPAHHRPRGQVCLDLLGPVEGQHRPIECKASPSQREGSWGEAGLPQGSWQGRQGAASRAQQRLAAALPIRHL